MTERKIDDADLDKIAGGVNEVISNLDEGGVGNDPPSDNNLGGVPTPGGGANTPEAEGGGSSGPPSNSDLA